MTCEETRRQIHAACDDDRTGALPELVRTHLSTCSACSDFAADLDTLSLVLHALPKAPLPAGALDAVWRDTIHARTGASTRVAGWWRLAAAVVVTALGTATLYLVFAPAPPSGPSAVELARASAQAEMVFGYTARALAATRDAAADRVLASKVAPAVRGAAASHPSRRP